MTSQKWVEAVVILVIGLCEFDLGNLNASKSSLFGYGYSLCSAAMIWAACILYWRILFRRHIQSSDWLADARAFTGGSRNITDPMRLENFFCCAVFMVKSYFGFDPNGVSPAKLIDVDDDVAQGVSFEIMVTCAPRWHGFIYLDQKG